MFVLCCGVFCYRCVFAFIVLDSGFSVLNQEIGWEERLQDDLFCVGLEVKHWLKQERIDQASQITRIELVTPVI